MASEEPSCQKIYRWETAGRPALHRSYPQRRRGDLSAPPWHREITRHNLMVDPPLSSRRAESVMSSASAPQLNRLTPRNPQKMSTNELPIENDVGYQGRGGRCHVNPSAAREVRQFLNKKLFPRPNSVLVGYHSLYHRLQDKPSSSVQRNKLPKLKYRHSDVYFDDTEYSKGVKSVNHLNNNRLHDPGRHNSSLIRFPQSSSTSIPRNQVHIYIPADDNSSASNSLNHIKLHS